MKKSICLVASLLALNLTPVLGQPANPGSASNPAFQQRLQSIIQSANTQNQPANPPPVLTKFNLNIPGGTPAQLVEAIEKATGKSLNAIIPTEDADLQMPPLKMNDVVVPQLFAALEAASRKTVAVSTGGFGGSYSQFIADYGFKTADDPLTDASIWYFHAERPSMPPMVSTEKVCRFFPLAAFLNRGFSVDDITTAIQTGWRMSGDTATPELSYHKETKLLIAFGEPDKLNTIQNVLQSLPSSAITQNDFDSLKDRVNELQKQIDQLKKQIPIPAPAAANPLEIKSGQ